MYLCSVLEYYRCLSTYFIPFEILDPAFSMVCSSWSPFLESCFECKFSYKLDEFAY